MPDLLLELFSEEIPARFQRRAAEDLKKAVTGAIVEAGLLYADAAAFVTPRRLTLTVTGLPERSPDTSEERKGPRVGAPPQAIDGFLKAAGLADISAARIDSDPKKGDFYVAVIEKQGAPAIDLLAAALPRIVTDFPWPKSMRWGDGKMSWVRPLRTIVATLSAENEETRIVPFAVDGLAAGETTFGHRFLAPDAIRVRRFEDYAAALEGARVVLDLDRRKEIIRKEAEQLAFAQGLELIADEGLLEEVAGLVEWPVPMLGSFDASFLAVPEEAVIATIRANQKCFCLRDPKTGKLANRFVLTANTIAADGGVTIIAGNERVIRARLSDAKFFYETDLKTRLEDGLPKLGEMVFHQQLGTQADRVGRIEAIAVELAPLVDALVGDVRRAARLAKADLVTQMVGEFPELQGIMGRYYAQAAGEVPDVALAISDHYKPVGPTDSVPRSPASVAVALADKLDLLTGFWAIDEKPTGSRDPFALRRAALGVIRILVENKVKLPLGDFLERLFRARAAAANGQPMVIEARPATLETIASGVLPPNVTDLIGFFLDRLKVMLRDQGARHDLVDAVLEGGTDDILRIVERVDALGALLSSEDGRNLLAGYRRAGNIVVAEEKKDGSAFSGDLELGLLKSPAEAALARAVEVARAGVMQKLHTDNYAGAMASLASLRQPVDEFFEAVLVNDADPAVRRNRLNLLARLRGTMHMVADFSRIEG